MEQFSKVVEHLQAAYIAGTGNPDIGPADGRMSRIGALIVEMGGPQAFFESQRQANIVRETVGPTAQKKTQSIRKPSATLLNANENPVLSNRIELRGVAGNPDKGYSAADAVTQFSEAVKKTGVASDYKIRGNARQTEIPEEAIEELNERSSNALGDSEFRIKRDFAEVVEKHFEAMELAHQTGEEDLGMLESEFAEDTRLLNETDYTGKAPKYVADNYSLGQIEATLNHLGIDFDPSMSPKQKAAHLVKSAKV